MGSVCILSPEGNKDVHILSREGNAQVALLSDVARYRCSATPSLGMPGRISTVDKYQGQVCGRAYVCIYIRMYIHTYVPVRMYTYIHTYIQSFFHAFIRIYIRVYRQTDKQTSRHPDQHTHTNTHTHTHTHTHTAVAPGACWRGEHEGDLGVGSGGVWRRVTRTVWRLACAAKRLCAPLSRENQGGRSRYCLPSCPPPAPETLERALHGAPLHLLFCTRNAQA